MNFVLMTGDCGMILVRWNGIFFSLRSDQKQRVVELKDSPYYKQFERCCLHRLISGIIVEVAKLN
jgi:hypothetical protein